MYKLEKYFEKGFNPATYWDEKYAAEYVPAKTSDAAKKQRFWPALESRLKKDGKYLDAGCGIGGWLIFLKEQGYDVAGIDVAAKTIRAITEYDPDANVRVAPMTQIPHPDASFDGVISIGTLEYIEHGVDTALAEVHRVLKPGGMFLLEVPIINGLRRLFYIPLKQLQKAMKSSQGADATFSAWLFDRAELKEKLDAQGFELELEAPHELPEEDGHYGLYVDWKFLRGRQAYQLNILGKFVKAVSNAISPWIASTGIVVIVRKK